jgi:hypothetical protein
MYTLYVYYIYIHTHAHTRSMLFGIAIHNPQHRHPGIPLPRTPTATQRSLRTAAAVQSLRAMPFIPQSLPPGGLGAGWMVEITQKSSNFMLYHAHHVPFTYEMSYVVLRSVRWQMAA